VNPFPIILSSPSGGGKTTIAKELLQRRPDLGYSVSCTTRAPRPDEVDGHDYYFMSVAEFLQERERDAFAESAQVHGNLYGTLRREVERVMRGGQHVVMDIDVQGARQFARAFPQSVLVFVLPPSAEVLLERLRRRKTESPAELAARLQSALQELQALDGYEYVVVNDDLERAVQSVSAIIDAEVVKRDRLRGLRQSVAHLIEQLEKEIADSGKRIAENG
jgi:guanylate kinase